MTPTKLGKGDDAANPGTEGDRWLEKRIWAANLVDSRLPQGQANFGDARTTNAIGHLRIQSRSNGWNPR